MIGARIRNRENQPKARRRANDFADWGISWGCGIPVADTQSGQRYYPLAAIELADLTADDFVFEAALLIAAARERHIGIVSVPIESRYQDEFRSSHFRPIRDVAAHHLVHDEARRGATATSSPAIADRTATPPLIYDPPTSRLTVSHVPHLLLQLAVILATARALALLLGRLGQPPVIGEMIAGIVLGPIVFGALAPDSHAWLFPHEKLAALEGLSQVGLVLFMFVVGAELRAPGGARERLVGAGWVGALGVLLPMLLGLAIAPVLYARFAPAGVAFWPFALFMAASMAITAFPVMARILKDARPDAQPDRSARARFCGDRRRVRVDHAGAGGCAAQRARRVERLSRAR